MERQWRVCAVCFWDERRYRSRAVSQRPGLLHDVLLLEICELQEQKAKLFVGVDWGTESHQVCALGHDRSVVGERSFDHSGEGLAQLVRWLREFAGDELGAVLVAIEVPHGAIVDTLLLEGCQVFSLNPKQLDRFRDRHSPSGAKDDRRDAWVLADSLRSDERGFRRLSPDDPRVNELREWSRSLGDLKRERVAIAHKLRGYLLRYFPEALSLASDLTDRWFLAFLALYPSPEAAGKAKKSSIAKLLKSYRIRKITAAQVQEIVQKIPLHLADGVVGGIAPQVKLAIQRLKLLNEQVSTGEKAVEKILKSLSSPSDSDDEDGPEPPSDVAILQSIPGVGSVVLSALLSEATHALRKRDVDALRALSGSAPVTKQSGKKTGVGMRHACNARLRDACYYWALVAMQRDKRMRSYYDQRRGQMPHAQLLRIIANKLIATACSMLRHGTLFDPEYSRDRAA